VRWIIVAVCAVAVIVVGYRVLNPPSDPLAEPIDCVLAELPDHGSGLPGVRLCLPQPSDVPREYWRAGEKTCIYSQLAGLGRVLDTKPTTRAVALAYSRWLADWEHLPADAKELALVRAGCIAGFSASA
jgi:hypothetical protein